MRNEPIRKICAWCGKGFSTEFKNKKLCSKKCQREGRNKWLRKYIKEMREIAREIGNCSLCFKRNDTPKYRMCFKCRKKKRK